MIVNVNFKTGRHRKAALMRARPRAGGARDFLVISDRPMRPNTLCRRQALLRALVGLTAGRLSLEGARSANAAYTVVSTGSISELRPKLADVAKKLGDNTFEDEPYLFGEKAQLECAPPPLLPCSLSRRPPMLLGLFR